MSIMFAITNRRSSLIGRIGHDALVSPDSDPVISYPSV